MRRCFSVFVLCVFSSLVAWAAPQATLTPVKWGHHRDPRVQRHHAHKATKHHAPKRAHRQGA
jgi:hypothetical protein